MKFSKVIILVVISFVLGCGFQQVKTPTTNVNVQSDYPSPVASNAYTCQIDQGGITANPCTQYIVQIVEQRGLSTVQIWQVPDNPVPISNYQKVAAGSNSATVQVVNPNQNGTSTISVIEP